MRQFLRRVERERWRERIEECENAHFSILSLMDENQWGFREGRSTADVTLVIVRMKEDADDYAKRVGRTEGEAREENDRMVARLLDLEKAYPRVRKPALWMLLERYGLKG